MNWNEFLPNLIYVVVAGLAAIIWPKVKPMLDAWIGKTNADLLASLADQAVKSAEQQLKGAPGNEKKAAAVAALQGLAEAHRLTINEASLHAAIEAAVYNLPKWLEASFLSGAGEIVPAPVAPADSAEEPIQPFNPAS